MNELRFNKYARMRLLKELMSSVLRTVYVNGEISSESWTSSEICHSINIDSRRTLSYYSSVLNIYF